MEAFLYAASIFHEFESNFDHFHKVTEDTVSQHQSMHPPQSYSISTLQGTSTSKIFIVWILVLADLIQYIFNLFTTANRLTYTIRRAYIVTC